MAGSDAAAFLQGQFTNDLQQAEGAISYGLWLNQKGRVLADSQALRLGENEFLLSSAHSSSAIIRERLESYIIADDVVLVDEKESYIRLLVWGAECSATVRELFGATPVSGRYLVRDGCRVFAGRQTRAENFEFLGQSEAVAHLRTALQNLNCSEADANETEWTRLHDGIPAVPLDIGPTDLPNEGGLELSAISFTKGCYLGQEVMARLKNMGQVRRRLQVVRGTGVLPQRHAALFQKGQKVGEMRSVAARGDEFVGLAMLTLLGFNPESGLSLSAAGPAMLRIVPHG